MQNNDVLISLLISIAGFYLYGINSAGRDFVIFRLIDLQREKGIEFNEEVQSDWRKFHRLELWERISIAGLVAYLNLGVSLSALAFSVVLLLVFRLGFEPRLNRKRDRDPWRVGETAETDIKLRAISNTLALGWKIPKTDRFIQLRVKPETLSKLLTIGGLVFSVCLFLIAFYFDPGSTPVKTVLNKWI